MTQFCQKKSCHKQNNRTKQVKQPYTALAQNANLKRTIDDYKQVYDEYFLYVNPSVMLFSVIKKSKCVPSCCSFKG